MTVVFNVIDVLGLQPSFDRNVALTCAMMVVLDEY